MRDLSRAVSAMVGAFISYAGWRGVHAGAWLLAAAILDGAGVLLLVPIIGVVVEGGNGYISTLLRGAGLVTQLQQLGVLIAAFVALSMVRAFTLYARDMVIARLQTGFIEAERNRAMRALAEAPWHRVVGLRHARVTNLITTEVQRLTSSSFSMVQGVVTAAMLVIQVVIAFSLAPGLAAVALLLFGIGGAVFLATQDKTHELGTKLVRSGQAMMGNAGGFLTGLKTAAAQNARENFAAEFEAIQTDIRAGQLIFQQRQAQGRLIFAIVSSLLGAGVVLAGFGFMQVSPAILITLVLVFGRMSTPAMQLYQAAQQFVFTLPSFEAVRGLEDELRGDGTTLPDAVPPPAGAIELTGASYQHPGGRGVRDATLRIEPGVFVGVAGPSGAGKTTLVDMIVGLLSPQSGTVSVGGKLLEDGLLAGWAGQIAYVSQEGFLFHDTVRRNLLWSNPQVDDEAIAAALEFAGATEIVARLEHGLDTVVGERGTLLSGGERQRIGLARALLRKPRLLVLDEAANAIDAAGEAALLGRLKALDPGPTILMISHREESLSWCDQVIRVAEGQVVQA
ncbi:ABC transporter ATP-binding protein [Sphingomonas sp. AOB5]|uniref:ABC transporter ATP-binding protein n=1 Tax=Sphingomonas sp. AOB5 TaxID=3034017 RepID=UPI0023F718EB|nr:ABC transporter ATP-binding protein [Sphingomonas sp. AOB5]MDF7776158.1 ABC transporter ATP-binding protein [Sphingomonas sp. AOB5]